MYFNNLEVKNTDSVLFIQHLLMQRESNEHLFQVFEKLLLVVHTRQV